MFSGRLLVSSRVLVVQFGGSQNSPRIFGCKGGLKFSRLFSTCEFFWVVHVTITAFPITSYFFLPSNIYVLLSLNIFTLSSFLSCCAAQTSNVIVTKSDISKHLCLMAYFKANIFNHSSCFIMSVMGFP